MRFDISKSGRFCPRCELALASALAIAMSGCVAFDDDVVRMGLSIGADISDDPSDARNGLGWINPLDAPSVGDVAGAEDDAEDAADAAADAAADPAAGVAEDAAEDAVEDAADDAAQDAADAASEGPSGNSGWSVGANLPAGAGVGKADPPASVPTSLVQVKGCVTCSLECSDDNSCTFDVPNDVGECLHLSYAPQCKRTTACGAKTQCSGDYCVGRAKDCVDLDPCTADACDPGTGACANVPIPGCAGPACGVGSACVVGSFCTTLGRCAPIEPAFQPHGPVYPKEAGHHRVMTYNTYYGFSSPQAGYDPQRGAKATAWIGAMAPDVVALQELTGWTVQQLAATGASWGHAHTLLLAKSSFKLGLTSAFPIETIGTVQKPLAHGLIHVRTGGVHYLVVHLQSNVVEKRIAEANALTALVSALLAAEKEVVVLGDLNSISPFDQDGCVIEAPSSWYAIYAPKAQPSGYLSTTEMSLLNDLGMIDTMAKLQLSWTRSPTHLVPNGPWGTRVDYVYASPALAKRLVRAWVADAPQRRGWSDHFPVVADFSPAP